MSKKKKTCYQCKHRRMIPGDTHTQCVFQWNSKEQAIPEGDRYGIENGWWYFPFNFDPTWMIGECSEFDTKDND